MTGGNAFACLEAAIAADVAGLLDEAIAGYERAIAASAEAEDRRTWAESLRRLAVTVYRRSDGPRARTLCQQSHDVAAAAGESLLAAQALNSLAAFDLADGEFAMARERFTRALASAGIDDALCGRIRQNLGIIANIQGQLQEAEVHYLGALDAFTACGDERGSAMAFNSLGILSADRQQWAEADERFRKSVELTTRLGDVHLRGLALLSHTEVHIALRNFDEAASIAGEALRIFNDLGIVRHKAEAYRVLGVVYRCTRHYSLAESRLRSALELARSAGAKLEEAESARELALLYRELGRNQDALRYLNLSQGLFRRLDARTDVVDVAARLDDLEGTFLAVVREWGQSIESADSYTFGHCERVATYAVAIARLLKLDQQEQTTIRLGAYLHDLGKIDTPHEILNKPGRLTDEEFEVMKRHTLDGVELLADIEFPWDIKPMIHSHHEKFCGGGYPDGLSGDAVPLSAQLICIADVFDALTTSRSYRAALPIAKAMDIMESSRAWWRPEIYAAFLEVIEQTWDSISGERVPSDL
ncbi:MAG: HD domain-containing phosphohydrolase [Gemmatimonadaceae bacterium]